jgi:hypothetical protein
MIFWRPGKPNNERMQPRIAKSPMTSNWDCPAFVDG